MIQIGLVSAVFAAAGLIDRDLAGGEKGGYRFRIAATPKGCTVSAAPIHFGIDGSRTYLSGSEMKIHIHVGPEPASVSDPAGSLQMECLLSEQPRRKRLLHNENR